jgi:hypothetical protein
MPNGCAVEWRECAATCDPRRALSLPEQAAGLRAISAVVAQSALSLAKLATLHCEERKERPISYRVATCAMLTMLLCNRLLNLGDSK